MHDEDISGNDFGPEPSPTERDDAKWQRAVLGLLLEQDPYRGSSPHQLSKIELAREILGENPSFDQRDAFERAVEDLIRAGLLQRFEAMILLTRAARHFASLEL